MSYVTNPRSTNQFDISLCYFMCLVILRLLNLLSPRRFCDTIISKAQKE
jgi:hypothetical protein